MAIGFLAGTLSVPCACLIAGSGVHGLTVNIPNEVYEFARGDNVTLPCTFVPKTKPSLVIITWSAQAEEANAKKVSLLFSCVNDYWLFLRNGKT